MGADQTKGQKLQKQPEPPSWATQFVAQNADKINQVLGVSNSSYQVLSEPVQVATGDNVFVTLAGLTDGRIYKIKVYVPPNNPTPQISRLTIRVRKSLAALKNTDERKGYFYCLKLLGVLPPPNQDFKNWAFFTVLVSDQLRKQQVYTPKCLHDVLIAMHATSCEHSSLYFGFFHRNLMVMTEIFLNFAHQVLRGGYEKLKQVYSGDQLKQLYNQDNKSVWQEVFKVYNGLKGIPDQIANHYWNPTNYFNDLDLKVLEEVAFKESTKDPVDLLFFSINKCYPWDVNVPRRWYNKPEQYDVKDLKNNGLFYTDKIDYTQDQKKLLSGQLDPRTNIQFYKKNKRFKNNWLSHSSNIVLNRNYQRYDQSKRNYSINSILDNEMLANYSAKSKNLQYISKQDEKEFNLKPPSYALNYNMSVPHYQYAQAFFTPDVKKFFYESQIENSHNTMHNNAQTIMNNPFFSITSLLFFAYHSWIDAGIQLYIRKTNGGDSAQFQALFDLFKNFQNALPGVLQNVISKASTFTEEQLKWQINGVSLEGNLAGAYPISEYISPRFKMQQNPNQNDLTVLEACFCAFDYILTKSAIRDSFHFNEIYQKYYIDRLHPNRFSFIKIKQYDFDYNYEVEAEPGVWQPLKIHAENLPGYLQSMEGQFIAARATKNIAVQKAAASKVVVKSQAPVSKVQKEPKVSSKVQKKDPREVKSGLVQQDDIQPTTKPRVQQDQKVRKLFKSGLLLFASHEPDLKNGNHLISLNLKKAVSAMHGELTQKEWQHYAEQEHIIGNIQIFGKAKYAKICPKCDNDKAIFLHLDDNVRVRLPKLWKFIHLKALNRVLYDSQNSNLKICCISQDIDLVPNEEFIEYRLVYGAEEIEVQLIDRTTSNESQYIRLAAESYSVSKNVISNVLSKKFYTFKSRFDFYKTFDVYNKNENDYFDRYVYKQLKGVIFVGQKKVEFSISIPCFQRLLRLNIEIIGNSNNLRVVVLDADYEVKQVFYKHAIQGLQ